MNHKFVFIILLFLILMGSIAFFTEIPPAKAEAKSIITIMEGGEVLGARASNIVRSGDTYTLNGDIQSKLVIKKDDIVFEGAGYCIQSYYMGIDVTDRNNVTIRNVKIKAELDEYGYAFGIVLTSSSNILVSNNEVTVPYDPQVEIHFARGIVLDRSSNNNVTSNTIISKGTREGIAVTRSSNNVIADNRLFDCTLSVWDSSGNSFSNNTNNNDEKQAVYLQDESNKVISDAGQVTLVNCNNITVMNAESTLGIQLENTHHSRLINCTAEITIKNSHENEVLNCRGKMFLSVCWGIKVYLSDFETVGLKDSYNCLIQENNITSTDQNETVGIDVFRSYNNTISGNLIEGHTFSFKLFYSGYNNIYQNCIIQDPNRIDSFNSINRWDNGTVGNYWSDYLIKHPNAEQIESSSTGNIPFEITSGNIDNHPLIQIYTPIGNQEYATSSPYPTSLTPSPSIPEFSSVTILTIIIVTSMVTLILFRKHHYSLN